MRSRKITLIIMNQGVGLFLGFLSLFFIARYMDKADFGTLGFAMGIVGMFFFFGDMGFSTAHVKKISEGKDMAKCAGTFFAIKIVLTGVFVVLVLSAIWVWINVLNKEFQSSTAIFVVFLILLYYVIMNIKNSFAFTFQAKIKTAIQESISFSENMTRGLIIIVVATLGLGAIGLGWAYIIGGLASLALAAVVFIKHRYPIGRPDMELAKDYGRFAFPVFLSASILLLALNTDKVFLQLFWGEESVANYFMAQRCIVILLGMASAVNRVFFPSISEAHSQGDMDTVKSLTRVSTRYLSMMMIPIVVFVAVLPKNLLNIMGSDYINAAMVLVILTIYALVYSFYGLYYSQISGMGKPGLTAKVAVVVALSNLFLNIIFIPESFFGIHMLGMRETGAGIATLLSASIGLILMANVSRNMIGQLFPMRNGLHIIAGGIMGLVLWGMTYIFYPVRIYEIGVFFMIGIGVYGLVLWIFKELKKEDTSLLFNMLNPKKMTEYIKSEGKNK